MSKPMEELTDAMRDMTTNEQTVRTLPNGFTLECVQHPTDGNYKQITVTGNLTGSSILFVGNLDDTPDDMPLTVLHFFGVFPEETGGCKVHGPGVWP